MVPQVRSAHHDEAPAEPLRNAGVQYQCNSTLSVFPGESNATRPSAQRCPVYSNVRVPKYFGRWNCGLALVTGDHVSQWGWLESSAHL